MGETHFALTYDGEVVIPVEIGMSSYRVQHFNLKPNEERLREQLDLLKERRQKAKVQMVSNKRKVKRYFNMWVRPIYFKEVTWC